MISGSLKIRIQDICNKFGYRITKISVSPEQVYENIQPSAEYSPWNIDGLFQETYKKIKANTWVDKYRCYELWTLVEQSAKLSGGIIEIGVWRGGSGALIAKKAKLCEITNPVYLCDTFTGVVKAGLEDPIYKNGKHADTSKQIVDTLVHKQLNLDNVQILEGVFPEQTAHSIKEKKFRLCHIDVDVYESAKDIVNWIWDKMVIGGIIVYDDYGFDGTMGIRKFVDEQRSNKDRIVIHNLNGHAIIIKIK